MRAADGAIEVIAEKGLRGLTHRAVDALAGLPPGSTSSCFRTRIALLSAVLDRLVELDERVLAALPAAGWTIDTAQGRAEIVDMLTDLVLYWLGPARSRTRARLELYLDASRRSELAPALEAANRRFISYTAVGMRAADLPQPEESARLLVAQLDGLLYDALARPFLEGADDGGRIRGSIDTIVRGYAG